MMNKVHSKLAVLLAVPFALLSFSAAAGAEGTEGVDTATENASTTTTESGSIQISGDLTLINRWVELKRSPHDGQLIPTVVSHFKPTSEVKTEVDGSLSAYGSCSVFAHEGRPSKIWSYGNTYVKAYSELEVSSGCADTHSWNHKLYRGSVKVGATYWGSADPGKTDYDTRSARCRTSASTRYEAKHSWVGGASTATLLCRN